MPSTSAVCWTGSSATRSGKLSRVGGRNRLGGVGRHDLLPRGRLRPDLGRAARDDRPWVASGSAYRPGAGHGGDDLARLEDSPPSGGYGVAPSVGRTWHHRRQSTRKRELDEVDQLEPLAPIPRLQCCNTKPSRRPPPVDCERCRPTRAAAAQLEATVCPPRSLRRCAVASWSCGRNYDRA